MTKRKHTYTKKKSTLVQVLETYYLKLFVLFYILYCTYTIFRSSFIYEGVRYFSLFDDMMISMRYAYNLVHGYGLVWNIGDRTEGFTNLLWILIMATVHLLPLPLSKTSLIMQLISTLCLLLTLYFVYKITRSLKQTPHLAKICVIFTGCYFPLLTGVLSSELK